MIANFKENEKMLYTVKNTAKSGSVFVGIRGLQTIAPGKSKVVELNDDDRGHADLVTLEHQKHLSVTAFKGAPAEAESKKPDPVKPVETKPVETKPIDPPKS